MKRTLDVEAGHLMANVPEEDLPYYRLAQRLLYDAALDFHAYWNSDLRRLIVGRTTAKVHGKKNKSLRALDTAQRLKARASVAQRWILGAYAKYPFEIAATGVGWRPDLLALEMMAPAAGERLYQKELQRHETEMKRRGKPSQVAA